MKDSIVSKASDNYSGARSKHEVVVDRMITEAGIIFSGFMCTMKTS